MITYVPLEFDKHCYAAIRCYTAMPTCLESPALFSHYSGFGKPVDLKDINPKDSSCKNFTRNELNA